MNRAQSQDKGQMGSRREADMMAPDRRTPEQLPAHACAEAQPKACAGPHEPAGPLPGFPCRAASGSLTLQPCALAHKLAAFWIRIHLQAPPLLVGKNSRCSRYRP